MFQYLQLSLILQELHWLLVGLWVQVKVYVGILRPYMDVDPVIWGIGFPCINLSIQLDQIGSTYSRFYPLTGFKGSHSDWLPQLVGTPNGNPIGLIFHKFLESFKDFPVLFGWKTVSKDWKLGLTLNRIWCLAYGVCICQCLFIIFMLVCNSSFLE